MLRSHCILFSEYHFFQAMILAHIPPGKFEKHPDKHWLYPEHNRAFLELLRTHADVIGSVHMAHHHTDSFRLIYDTEGSYDGTEGM